MIVAFFGGLPLPVLDHPALVASNSVVIASLLDLAGTKAKALLDRIERKDYQDILELLDAGLSMSQIAGAAEAIFPAQVSSIMVLRALSHYGDGAARALPDTWKERLSPRGSASAPDPDPSGSVPQYLVVIGCRQALRALVEVARPALRPDATERSPRRRSRSAPRSRRCRRPPATGGARPRSPGGARR